ncbi:hypothetical protein BpHYR1_050825 [Brachionus plicatilis]|uniref:Uncharacterized protein n=1 Tax=Brachionus plicatilis TaxID=10195 RepID=A0A3M7T810_BRAPC|nr:hypothetical protein BpHYR1_050825 [Brachionus plicatilis]
MSRMMSTPVGLIKTMNITDNNMTTRVAWGQKLWNNGPENSADIYKSWKGNVATSDMGKLFECGIGLDPSGLKFEHAPHANCQQ